MMDSGETTFVEPKGHAETLRQKDRTRTILCRVSLTHAEGATGSFRESLRLFQQRHKTQGCFVPFSLSEKYKE